MMLNRCLMIGIIAFVALFVLYNISLHEKYMIASLNNLSITPKDHTESSNTNHVQNTTNTSSDSVEATLARSRCMNEHPFQVYSQWRKKNLTLFALPAADDEWVSGLVINSKGDPSKIYKSGIRDNILKVLSKANDPLVLDIGANIGIYTVFIANAGYRVHAFEPYKMNHPILHCDLIVNGFNESQVKINTFGLSRQKEDLCMVPQPGNAHATYVGSKRECEPENIASFQRLDEYLETWMKGEVPYLIKIYLNGYELHALETAKEYFKKYGAPKHIFTEFFPGWLKRAGTENPEDYLNFLWDLNMTISYNGNVIIKNTDHYRMLLTSGQVDLHAYQENDHSCFVDPRKLSHQLSGEDSYTVVRNIHNECENATEVVLGKCMVPKVIHTVIFGNHFKFHHYVSIKSIHLKIKPDYMFVHGNDFPVNNTLFDRAIEEFGLILVESREMSKIYHNTVTHPAHKSDVIRLESVTRFGGMYFDLDVFVLKDMDPFLENELTMGMEGEFKINNGIIIAKRCSRFLLNWYRQYHTYDDNQWTAHSVELPMKLFKANNHTGLSLQNRTLWQHFRFFSIEYDEKDWRDVRAVHTFYRGYNKDHNFEDVKTLNNMFGRLARHILYDGPLL